MLLKINVFVKKLSMRYLFNDTKDSFEKTAPDNFASCPNASDTLVFLSYISQTHLFNSCLRTISHQWLVITVLQTKKK